MHILIVFGYWNPMGFIPEFCLIKALCLVGIWSVALPPSGAARSQMDQGEGRGYHKMKLKN